MSGAEVSVWRYLIGSVCLLLVSVSLKGSRDLITPL
ncbi:MAG: EamA family transporter, partial [Acidiferrobacteraceae bacterium]|nr:EamA family transporter [Acidiferrobacteraceae bacterium]